MNEEWAEAMGDSKLVGMVTSRGVMAGACVKHLGATADGRSVEDRLKDLRRLRILCDSAIQQLTGEKKAISIT